MPLNISGSLVLPNEVREYEYRSIIQDGLVLHLDARIFNTISGTSWFDFSGNSLHSTLTNGPTFNSDNQGSIIFDGTDDHGIISHTTLLNPTLSMTLSAWVYLNSFKTNMSIFGKGTSTSGQGGYDFRIDANNQLNLVKYFIADQKVTLSTALSTGIWYNIVAVQSATQVQYFVNGNSVGSFNNSAAYQTNTAEFRIARDRGTVYTSTRISHILFYNRALTADEITHNYNVTKYRYGL